MNQTSYNGWTNYETWNAALWLDNDQGSQEYWNEAAQDCLRAARMYDHDETFSAKEHAAFRLEEQLKDSFKEEADQHNASGWLADAINAYLSEVNWCEIAQHFLEDVEEESEVSE